MSSCSILNCCSPTFECTAPKILIGVAAVAAFVAALAAGVLFAASLPIGMVVILTTLSVSALIAVAAAIGSAILCCLRSGVEENHSVSSSETQVETTPHFSVSFSDPVQPLSPLHTSVDTKINILLVGEDLHENKSLMQLYPNFSASHTWEGGTATHNIDSRNVLVTLCTPTVAFRSYNFAHYRTTHVFLLVFDLTDYATFHKIKEEIQNIDRYGNEGLNPIRILVGTKGDLDRKRMVDFNVASAFALENRLNGYIEVSSTANQHVQELFHRAVSLALAHRQTASL